MDRVTYRVRGFDLTKDEFMSLDPSPDDYVYYEYKNSTLSKRIEFKNGLRHGNYEEFYPNGKLSAKGYYKNGKKNGTYRKWREDGTLLRNIKYKDDIKNGKTKIYGEDGIILYSIEYFNNKKHGVQKNLMIQDGLFSKYLEIVYENDCEIRARITVPGLKITINEYDLTDEGRLPEKKFNRKYKRKLKKLGLNYLA